MVKEIIISFLLNLGLLANFWSLIRKKQISTWTGVLDRVGKLVYLFCVIMLSLQYDMYRCYKPNGVAEFAPLANWYMFKYKRLVEDLVIIRNVLSIFIIIWDLGSMFSPIILSNFINQDSKAIASTLLI